MRKKPTWTKAARRRAAEHGRIGGKLGTVEGKRRGGLVAWHTRTPEEQEAIRVRLRAAGGQQRNTSARARAAQRARRLDQRGRVRVHSQAQAGVMAGLGLLRSAPLPAPVTPTLPPDYPIQGPHEDAWAYRCRVQDWHRGRYEEGRVAE